MTTSRDQDRGLTKLTAKLFAPMYVDFDRQLSDAFLRRDAFLDRVISQEIPHLREDLNGKRLSDEANKYISRSLKGLGGRNTPPLRQVSIAVRHETAEGLRAVVEEHNLVRDAFLNRLIALLRASDKLLEALELPKRISRGRSDGTEDMPTSPLRAIEETIWDPFHYLRAACQVRYGHGLHLLEFPVDGFNCYMGDEHVPGTRAYTDRKEADEFLLKELEDFEAGFVTAKTQGV